MRIISLTFVALLTFAACSNFGPKEIQITGQVNNLNNNFALLISKGITDTIWLNDDGSFTKTIETSEPSYYTLRTGRTSNMIYLAPGDDINVLVDISNPANNPVVDGKTAKENNLVYEVNKTFTSFSKDFRGLYTLPSEEFYAKTDSVKEYIHSMINDSEVTNKTFLALEKARVNYRIIGFDYDYPEYSARFSGQEFIPEPDTYSFMDNINMSNIEHFSISEYTNLIYKHLQKGFWAELKNDEHKGKSEFERSLMFFEIIDEAVADQKIKDFFKFNSTSETVKWASLEVSKNVAEHFIANSKTKVYSDIVDKALAKRMLLAPGQPAPSFTLTGIDGKEYSLEDFKGQLVYIDFWATWCGPCLREIPSLTTLKEAYKNKPIAIIAISLDDDKDAWVKMVTERPLKGIQLHAEKAWLSDVAKDYQIFGIPTFVLIDAEGKIIEYPASRPSNPETALIFDKYLKQL